MNELEKNLVSEKNGAEGGVVMYNYKDISSIFKINSNKAIDFLKKYGVKVGSWKIERRKLIKVLNENEGRLI